MFQYPNKQSQQNYTYQQQSLRLYQQSQQELLRQYQQFQQESLQQYQESLQQYQESQYYVKTHYIQPYINAQPQCSVPPDFIPQQCYVVQPCLSQQDYYVQQKYIIYNEPKELGEQPLQQKKDPLFIQCFTSLSQTETKDLLIVDLSMAKLAIMHILQGNKYIDLQKVKEILNDDLLIKIHRAAARIRGFNSPNQLRLLIIEQRYPTYYYSFYMVDSRKKKNPLTNETCQNEISPIPMSVIILAFHEATGYAFTSLPVFQKNQTKQNDIQLQPHPKTKQYCASSFQYKQLFAKNQYTKELQIQQLQKQQIQQLQQQPNKEINPKQIEKEIREKPLSLLTNSCFF